MSLALSCSHHGGLALLQEDVLGTLPSFGHTSVYATIMIAHNLSAFCLPLLAISQTGNVLILLLQPASWLGGSVMALTTGNLGTHAPSDEPRHPTTTRKVLCKGLVLNLATGKEIIFN